MMDTPLMDTLEAQLAQWTQNRDDAVKKMNTAREWLDSHDLMNTPRRRKFILMWNENLSRYEWANTQIGRIKAAIKARDGKL